MKFTFGIAFIKYNLNKNMDIITDRYYVTQTIQKAR